MLAPALVAFPSTTVPIDRRPARLIDQLFRPLLSSMAPARPRPRSLSFGLCWTATAAGNPAVVSKQAAGVRCFIGWDSIERLVVCDDLIGARCTQSEAARIISPLVAISSSALPFWSSTPFTSQPSWSFHNKVIRMLLSALSASNVNVSLAPNCAIIYIAY